MRCQGSATWTSFLVGPVFLLLAAWFLWDPTGVDLPVGSPDPIDPSRISTTPRRADLDDPPTVEIEGVQRTCQDCHHLFLPREDAPVSQLQHSDIVLEHGINDRCRNCHHVENRNKLVLRGGAVIGFSESPLLCQKCHGPTFRDWQRGAHGRTNGYWDASRGEVRRLDCSECHDPHHPRHPAMDPIEPLPAPHTLRMGERSAEHEDLPEEEETEARSPGSDS